MTSRPQFVFPSNSFTAIDLAIALGKSRNWAMRILGRMKEAEIVRQIEDGKYRFTLGKRI